MYIDKSFKSSCFSDSDKVHFFKGVVEPIEKLEVPLQTTWGISKVLYSGNQSLMPTNCYLNIHKRSWTAISQKYVSKPIYEAAKKAREEMKDLTDEERRILEKYVLEGMLNGLDIVKPKDREYFQLLMGKISMKSDEFRYKLEIATNIFKHKITDPHKMKGFPDDFLKSVAVDPAQYEVGPWIITLKSGCYQTFMGMLKRYANNPFDELLFHQ